MAREPVYSAVNQPRNDELIETGGHDGNSGVCGSAEVAFDDPEAGEVAHGEREFKRSPSFVDYYVTRRSAAPSVVRVPVPLPARDLSYAAARLYERARPPES